MTKLKNSDTLLFNCEVLTKREGELIVARRSQVKRPAIDYLPCTFCFNFFVSEEIWRHARTCQFNVDPENILEKGLISSSRVMVDAAVLDTNAGYCTGFVRPYFLLCAEMRLAILLEMTSL